MSQHKSTPSVSVNAVVFFQTDEQATQYATILQDVVTKVLIVFNACNDTALSFRAKQEWVMSLTSTRQQLQQLLELDTILAAVGDAADASMSEKFRGKISQIQQSIDNLQNCFNQLERQHDKPQGTESRSTSVQLYKQVFEEMLKLLQLNVDLMRLQREQKVADISSITYSTLLSLKKLSQVKTQSDLVGVISDCTLFLSEISNRTQILASVTVNSKNKQKLEEGVTALSALTGRLSTVTVATATTTASAEVVQPIVQCLQSLLATLQQQEEFSSVFSVEYEGSDQAGDRSGVSSIEALSHIQQQLQQLSQYVRQGLALETSTMAANIIKEVRDGIESSIASADTHLQNAYENLQEKLKEMLRVVKQALASHQGQDQTSFQQHTEALDLLIAEISSEISLYNRRRRSEDEDFNLLDAALMVMRAINGITVSN